MWQTVCILAEGLLHLICFVGLMAAIGVLWLWIYAAFVMYQWMHQQSGHGVRYLQSTKMDGQIFCNGLPPGSRGKAVHVVNKSGVM